MKEKKYKKPVAEVMEFNNDELLTAISDVDDSDIPDLDDDE